MFSTLTTCISVVNVIEIYIRQKYGFVKQRFQIAMFIKKAKYLVPHITSLDVKEVHGISEVRSCHWYKYLFIFFSSETKCLRLVTYLHFLEPNLALHIPLVPQLSTRFTADHSFPKLTTCSHSWQLVPTADNSFPQLTTRSHSWQLSVFTMFGPNTTDFQCYLPTKTNVFSMEVKGLVLLLLLQVICKVNLKGLLC